MNPIVLLHGALGSSSQLLPVMQLLEQHGRNVYRMNFSGHSGELFQSTFGIETFTEDILHFLDEHKISTADFFGYSMGGYVALWLAHQHSERVGKIITLGTKFDWSPDSAIREVAKLDPEKIQQKVPAFARILEHRHAPNDWKVLLRKTAGMMLHLGHQPLLTPEVLRTITNRVEVCLGDRDDMADRDYTRIVANTLPNAAFHLLDNTTHPIEKVNLDLLMSFFQE
ncbi:MAG: alpha/beta hydrolase [Cyclobacteriaceae bacterium]|nr:alpha/beta hydrolase [Cyclobacteriaceae bacterium]